MTTSQFIDFQKAETNLLSSLFFVLSYYWKDKKKIKKIFARLMTMMMIAEKKSKRSFLLFL
jgi:hypothetical protein